MPTTKKKSPRPRLPECCRRKREGGEIYRYFYRNFEFDVDRANELVQDGRKPVLLERESVRLSVENSRIDVNHVRHVDPKRPGIVAHVRVVTEEGKTVHGHVLIDGNHRAAACLQCRRPFRVFVLSKKESREILLKEPHESFTAHRSKKKSTPRRQKPRT